MIGPGSASPAPARQGLVDIDWGGRPTRLEYAWLTPRRAAGTVPAAAAASPPLMVFLHEGLGSLAMWKDFPARLCDALGWRGLVWSRPGYGRSTPRGAAESWAPDFMHRQAHEVLPALLRALQVDAGLERPWLYGHSDGGSIALLHAARYPDQVGGLVVAAPHILVEPISLHSIARARDAYLQGDLRRSLARYHDDPDSAFWGWNDVWLAPDFAGWRIDEQISGITCPLLAVQGVDDEYGTLEQVRGITRRVAHAELLELPDCGHSPHRDQRERLIAAVCGFAARHGPG